MKSRVPYLWNTDLALSPNPIDIDIDEKLGQSLSRLMGWDTNNNIFRRVLTDVDGRLLVSTSPTQGASANQPQFTLAAVTTQILGINSSRRTVVIQNLGAVAIYIGFGIPATVAGGLQIAAGGSFIDDHFTGAINAIAASGTCDIRIVEF